MKMKIQMWTLAWDTSAGTDCQVFQSEAACIDCMASIILSSISECVDEEAIAIRAFLGRGELGDAYELWQEEFKEPCDSYNWGPQDLELDLAMLNEAVSV